MSRRTVCGVLAACLVFSQLTGCGDKAAPSSAPEPSFGVQASAAEPVVDSAVESQVPVSSGTFSMPYNGSYGWNPYTCRSMENQAVMQMIYQGLFTLNQSFDAEPVLCKDFSVSDDGLTYTITLQSAWFSNGSALTAADVTYSLSQAQESELYSERFTDISGYEAVDSGTVAIYLSQPNDRLPCLLNFPIIRDGSSPNGSPQGTGPFVRNGDVLTLDQNWWQGAERVQFQTVTLCSSTSAEDTRDNFEMDNVDLVYNDPQSSTAATFHCDYELWNSPNTVMQYIGFNMTTGLCSSKDIRTAIIRAIDRSTIAESVYHNFADPTALPVPAISSLYNKELARNYEYDADTALTQLLDNSLFYLPDDDPRLTGGPGAQRNQTDDAAQDSSAESSALEEDVLPDETDPEADPETDPDATQEDTAQEEETTYNDLVLIVLSGNANRVAAAKLAAEQLTDMGFTVTVKSLAENEFLTALNTSEYDLYYADVCLSPDLDLRPLLKASGDLNYGGIPEDSVLSDRIYNALENSGNHYDLYQYVMDQGYLCPILFENNAVFTSRGVFSGLAPAPGNLIYDIQTITVK